MGDTKVRVHRKNSGAVATLKTSNKGHPRLDRNAPVQTTRPSSASWALRPGPILTEGCNGSDIVISKTATASKNRPKFLLIFPGNFSFPVSTSNDNAAGEAEDAKTTTTSTTPTWGKLKNVETEKPYVEVSFSSTRRLVFPGTKVSGTTTKFMVLTCKQKRGGGTVHCKSIFTSAIVLGPPHWEGSEGPASGAELPTLSQSHYQHYGGSVRAVDGAGRGKQATSTTAAAKCPSSNGPLSGDKTGSMNKEDEASWGDDDDDGLPAPVTARTTRPVRRSASKTALEDSSNDTSDYESDEPSVPTPTVRRAPKRASSLKPPARRPSKGTADSLSDNDTSDYESDEPSAPTTSVRKAPKRASYSKPTTGRTTKAALDLSSDDDEVDNSEAKLQSDSSSEGSDDDEEEEDWAPAPRRKKRVPSSARKQTTGSLMAGSSEEDKKQKDPPFKSAAPSPRLLKRRRSTEKAIETKVITLDDDNDSDGSEADAAPPPRKVHKRSTTPGQKKKAHGSASEQDSEAQSPISFRSRRKKGSSPARARPTPDGKKKGTGAPRVLDLSQDSDFEFL